MSNMKNYISFSNIFKASLPSFYSIKSEEPPTAILKPYLLLDVRDYDQYSKSHIITAENYPKVHLARANYESASLLKYVSVHCH